MQRASSKAWDLSRKGERNCIWRCPLTSLNDGRYSPAGMYLWSTESIQCSWGRVFTRRFLFHKLQVKGWKSPSLRDTCHRKSRILCLLCLVCFFVLLLVGFSTSQYVYRVLFHCCYYCCCHLFTIYNTSEHSTLKVNDGKFDFYENNDLICLLKNNLFREIKHCRYLSIPPLSIPLF